jgi:hypothetical protein
MFRLLRKFERAFTRAVVWGLWAFAAGLFIMAVAWPVWCILGAGCWLYGAGR